MSFTIGTINPKNYIASHKHATESTKTVSTWFLNEQIEIDFGDSVGRPSENILLKREYITQFLQNGWTIDAVMNSSSNGVWETNSESHSESSTKSSSQSGSASGGSGSASGSVSSSSTVSDATKRDSGESYWYAKQRVRLKRRRMQPEKVMQSMMTSFTKAYNSGRQIEDSRFDELMSLFSAVIRTNETEGRSLLTNAINPSAFLETLYNSTWGAFNSAQSSANKIADTATEAATADINRQFDALVAQKKAEMISTGLYNTTVWPSVQAGLERERAAALVKAKNEGTQIAASALTSVGSAKASAATAFTAAKQAIADALDKRCITVMEMRNNVIKWIVDFVGSREEVYPELEEISSVAERLGFSVGSAGNVL